MSGSYIGQSTIGCLPDHTHNPPYWTNDSSGHHALGDYPNGHVPNDAKPNIYGYGKPTSGASDSIYGNGWYSGAKVVPAGTGVSYIIKY